MRSLVVSLLCSMVLVLVVRPALAQYAVTDAGAYGYYAEQIKQMTRQIEEIKAQTVGQFQRLEDIKAQVSGQFSGLKQVYTQLNGIKQTFDVKPTNLLAETQKWTKLKDLVGSYTGIEGALADTFKDPRSLAPDVNQIAYANRQYNMRQQALKNSISHADALLQSIPDRLAAIDAMQAAATKAQSQGDKQDMTNALLVELLRTLTTYASVLVEFHQSAALLNFRGTDEAVMKQREAVIWAVKKKTDSAASAAAMSQQLKGLGVDAGMSQNYKF